MKRGRNIRQWPWQCEGHLLWWSLNHLSASCTDGIFPISALLSCNAKKRLASPLLTKNKLPFAIDFPTYLLNKNKEHMNIPEANKNHGVARIARLILVPNPLLQIGDCLDLLKFYPFNLDTLIIENKEGLAQENCLEEVMTSVSGWTGRWCKSSS